jgi:effector-binding domain-containing protein
MQIKVVKPVNFLFFRTEARVAELSNFLPIAKELFREAVQLDLWITGPIHWHYYGFTPDEAIPFTLEIALPVAALPAIYDGKFHSKRTDPFRCVSAIHEGSWYEIPHTYGKLMGFLSSNKLVASAVNRELYINADFNNPEANVTEIQFGIQAA